MAISASQLRRGSVVLVNGDPHRVVEYQSVKPGKGPAYMQTKLRNLRSGAIFDQRYRSADTVETATLETHELQFLYADGTHYHFMNNETFEMSVLDEDALEGAAQWLTPNLVIQAEIYDGSPIGVTLPKTLDLEVVETEPGVRGDTKTAVTKPAKLENGAVVMVPPFIDVGEKVRVDPSEGVYLERAR
ncbi:MAG TPA: elongation factor P [Longimicrobiales bacterium]|nr:elongation factor P [Longimicrobiales bacterium]